MREYELLVQAVAQATESAREEPTRQVLAETRAICNDILSNTTRGAKRGWFGLLGRKRGESWQTLSNGMPIEIVSSGGTTPAEARYVDIKTGEDEFLRLHDNSGEIFSKKGYKEEIVPRLGIFYEGKLRNPSLEDAQEWQNRVNALVITSSSQA